MMELTSEQIQALEKEREQSPQVHNTKIQQTFVLLRRDVERSHRKIIL